MDLIHVARRGRAIGVAQPLAMLLHLLRRGLLRVLQQVRLVLRRRHAAQRAYLGVRQLARREGARDLRQVEQRRSNAHLLARGADRDAALHVQPLGAVVELPCLPALPDVELAHQLEERVLLRVDALGMGDELLLELVQGTTGEFEQRGHRKLLFAVVRQLFIRTVFYSCAIGV